MKKFIHISLLLGLSFWVKAQEKKNIPAEDFNSYVLNKALEPAKMEFFNLTDALVNPTIVTSLKLNRQGLKEIPSEISKFKNLTELDLSDNEINDFSAKLTELSLLQKLNLSGNNLTVIPADVCNLKNLKVLNLSSNKIASGNLSCLNSVERLFLNNNELVSLPAGITTMQSLKSLYLHSNKLTELDEKLAKLTSLEVLLVQFNKISEEPLIFQQNGIYNYSFTPQNVNNKYLYKYITSQPIGSASTLDEDNKVKVTPFESDNAKPRSSWERIVASVAIRNSFGYARHKAIKEEGLDRINWDIFNRPFIKSEIEFSKGNSGFGLYFSRSELYELTSTVKYELVVIKTGFNYRRYLNDLSKRIRPYATIGIGVNIERNYSSIVHDYYGPINLQARVGIDLYLLRFFGLNIEGGVGSANLVSAGLIYRFNKRSKA